MVLHLATNERIRPRHMREGLTITEVAGPDRPMALASLRHDLVYEIGTSEGCACALGILLRGMPEVSELESDVDSEPFQQAFLSLLEELIETGPVEIYPCWDGDEKQRPDSHNDATIADLKESWSLLCERRVTRLSA